MNSRKILCVLSSLFVIFLSLNLRLLQASSEVVKVNSSGSKAHIKFEEANQYTEGEILYSMKEGKRVSKIKIVQLSKKGTKALAQVVNGEALTKGQALFSADELMQKTSEDDDGLALLDDEEMMAPNKVAKASPKTRKVASQKAKRRHVSSEEDDEERDEDEEPRARTYDGGNEFLSPGYLSIHAGYDVELIEKVVEGGFTFGMSGAFKMSQDWALGLLVQHTVGKIRGNITIPNFGLVSINESFSGTYLMPQLTYFFTPNFFAGISAGAVIFDADSTELDDTFFAGGLVFGYDYFLDNNFSLGIKSNLTYINISNEFLGSAATYTVAASASYWF